MNTVLTFRATIHVGFRVRNTGQVHRPEEARAICQRFCDEVGLCVSVTATEFIYTNGSEPGCVVGLINYPRFPATPVEIEEKALRLAELLMLGLGQWRVSVVFPDRTVMLSNPEIP
jgi:hypothetical protein